MNNKDIISLYDEIINHLKSHILEGNYDDLDIEQLKKVELSKKKLIKQNQKVGKGIKLEKLKHNDEIYNVSNPEIAQKKAFDYLGPTAILYKGDKGKKYKIYDYNNMKWISFGDINYEDMTYHNDGERQKRYLSRANKIKGDWKSNPYSKNNLSINILW